MRVFCPLTPKPSPGLFSHYRKYIGIGYRKLVVLMIATGLLVYSCSYEPVYAAHEKPLEYEQNDLVVPDVICNDILSSEAIISALKWDIKNNPVPLAVIEVSFALFNLKACDQFIEEPLQLIEYLDHVVDTNGQIVVHWKVLRISDGSFVYAIFSERRQKEANDGL